MKRDYKISYIRALSTILIVIIHVSLKLSYIYPEKRYLKYIDDWGNLGLVLFFVISSFLYAQRDIRWKRGKWFIHRYVSLVIPALLANMVYYIFLKLIESGNERQLLPILLSSLGFEAFLSGGGGMFHLWFLTYILFCNLTVPAIQRLNYSKDTSAVFYLKLCAFIVVLQVACVLIEKLLGIPFLSAAVLLRFYVPYILFKRYEITSNELKRLMKYLLVLLIPLVIVTCYVRYCFNFEGIYAKIAELLFIYTQTFFGIILFYYLYLAFDKVMQYTKLLNFTDRYSFPIYLTHCFFIVYEPSFITTLDKPILGVLLALILTMIASIFLSYVWNILKRKLECGRSVRVG